MLEDEWRIEDEKYKNHCNNLYEQWQKAYANEERLRQNSKSARIAKKLEQMKLTDQLVSKIKLTNEKVRKNR